MKTKAVIAGVLLLLLPLSYSVSTITIGNSEAKTTNAMAITWSRTKTTTTLFNTEQTEFNAISVDWFKTNNYFEYYFGDTMWIYVVLALIVLAISLAISKEDLITGPVIIIVTSVIILLLRSQALADNDTSWIKTTESFGTTLSYREIPIAPIISAVLSALDLKKK